MGLSKNGISFWVRQKVGFHFLAFLLFANKKARQKAGYESFC
jgi:hypothetical protein